MGERSLALFAPSSSKRKEKKGKKTCAKATANRGEVTQKLSGEKRNDQIYRPDLGVSALAQ